MELKYRKYKTIDIIRLSYRVASLATVCQFIVVILEGIVSTSLLALTTAYLVDSIANIFDKKDQLHSIYLPLGLLLLTLGVNSILSSLPRLLEARIKFGLERELVPAILQVRAELSYKYIEDAKSWELVDYIEKELIETFLDGLRAYGAVVRSVIAILSVLTLVILQLWWAAIIILIFSVPLFLVSLWAGKKNYAAKVETRRYERRYSYYSDEILTNRDAISEKLLFNYSDEIISKYYSHFVKARDIQLKVLLKTRLTMRTTSIALVVLTSITSFMLIKPILNNEISVGMFMGIIAALFGMVETLGWQMQDCAKNISEAKSYMKDFTKFINFERTKGALDMPNQNPIVFKNLEFKKVSFKYPNAKDYILRDLSFTLENGKHYAFVGTNGAGKSTIIKLITALYRDYEGEILLNGKELKKYEFKELKSIFSVLYQDFVHYEISLIDNIKLGRIASEANLSEINEVIEKSELVNLVEKINNRIYEPLGKINDSGIELSGGEWQKVAIARSILSNSPIKILDEPTSALDPIAENKIYQKFEELMKGKTTIFISHRLGSTKLADEILVIDGGKIIERGNHSQLMNFNGKYRMMFEAQRKWYDEK